MSIHCRSRVRVRVLVLVALLCSANAGRAAPSAAALQDAYVRLVALDQATLDDAREQRVTRLRDAYARDFAPLIRSADLQTASAPKLDVLMRATQRLAYYSDDPQYLEDMASVVQRLGPSIAPDAVKIYHASLIQFRRFDQVRQLALQHPDVALESVPRVVAAPPPARPNAYVMETRQRQLREIEIPLHDATLIAVVHPHCGFSRRAMDALRGSPLLQGLTVRWIAPVGRRIDYDVFVEWNAAHADQSIVLARRTADWPMIDDWATPTFYLLRNGKLVAHFSGWPKDGNQELLLELGRNLDPRRKPEPDAPLPAGRTDAARTVEPGNR